MEAKGKSSAIKENQFGKLEAAYNSAVSKIFGAAPNQAATPVNAPATQPPTPINTPAEQPPETPGDDYKVRSVKPSGKSSQMLELIGGNGEVITTYIKTGDQSTTTGTRLLKVKMERKDSTYGEYNLITDYKAA